MIGRVRCWLIYLLAYSDIKPACSVADDGLVAIFGKHWFQRRS